MVLGSKLPKADRNIKQGQSLSSQAAFLLRPELSRSSVQLPTEPGDSMAESPGSAQINQASLGSWGPGMWGKGPTVHPSDDHRAKAEKDKAQDMGNEHDHFLSLPVHFTVQKHTESLQGCNRGLKSHLSGKAL